uniref:Putative secreted protein n=1 Tax=Anopheles darlingi TaxID=43151 RepID=A0A2M4DPK2_ANODA
MIILFLLLNGLPPGRFGRWMDQSWDRTSFLALRHIVKVARYGRPPLAHFELLENYVFFLPPSLFARNARS